MHQVAIERILNELRHMPKSDCLRKTVWASVYSHGEILFSHSNKAYACNGILGDCGCVHAELICVLDLLNGFQDETECVLFSTYSPCTKCAHAIIECGRFVQVYYSILTNHDTRGRDFLRMKGIPCDQGS